MSDFRLPHRSDYGPNDAYAWDECVMCGRLARQALVHFKQGTVVPTENETVTGATSGDTGTLFRYVLVSGSFAAGTAAGILILKNLTGYDDCNLEIFEKNENLNGSTSGNSAWVASAIGAVEVSGRLMPTNDLIDYEGKKYCKNHFRFRYENRWADEAKVDSDESDRGNE